MTKVMTQNHRSHIIDRIRKLSKLTITNGATEGEALNAATLLHRLIAEYNVQTSELTICRDAIGCVIDDFIQVGAGRPYWMGLGGPIARLFNCKHYTTSKVTRDPLGLGLDVDAIAVRFYGFPEDVAAAIALMSICHIAVMGASANVKRRAKDFEQGLIDRLGERITAMAKPAPTAKGTALIVLKDQLVTQEYVKWLQANGIRLGHRSFSPHNANADAYAAGKAAGSRVDLGGAKLASGPKAIGFRS